MLVIGRLWLCGGEVGMCCVPGGCAGDNNGGVKTAVVSAPTTEEPARMVCGGKAAACARRWMAGAASRLPINMRRGKIILSLSCRRARRVNIDRSLPCRTKG